MCTLEKLLRVAFKLIPEGWQRDVWVDMWFFLCYNMCAGYGILKNGNEYYVVVQSLSRVQHFATL